MTLLLTAASAVISTVIWYCSEKARKLKIGLLCQMFWGASLMWLIDAFFEYSELHEKYFTPKLQDMINDAYLGLSVIVLALIIWTAVFLYSDPCGVIAEHLKKNKAQ